MEGLMQEGERWSLGMPFFPAFLQLLESVFKDFRSLQLH